jgi:MFS family permease
MGSWNDAEGGGMYKANVLHLGLSFFLVYTAFSGIQNLSSSLIKPQSLGSATIGVLYCVFATSCLIGPAFVARIGNARSLTFGFGCIVFFCVAYVVASNDHGNSNVNWPILLLAGSAVGFAASPIWVAQGAYITQMAKLWSAADPPAAEIDASGAQIKADDGTIPRMGDANGLFWACFQATQISGNLLPSVMLGAGASNTAVFLVYLGFAICGTIVASMLRAPPAEVVSDDAEEQVPVMESVRGMVDAWSNPRMYSLIPIIMYSGLEMGFIWGDFTSNYVQPTLGSAKIGYVMCIFGCADIMFSFFFGKISDMPRIGRMPVLAAGALAQLAIIIVALSMKLPDCDVATTPGHDYSDGACLDFYQKLHKQSPTIVPDYGTTTGWWVKLVIMAFVWSIGDAAWNTQLNSIISETFTEDPAPGFANLKLWQSAMTGAAFFYNTNIKPSDKLYIMLFVLGIGALGLANLKFNVNKAATLREPLIGTA